MQRHPPGPLTIAGLALTFTVPELTSLAAIAAMRQDDETLAAITKALQAHERITNETRKAGRGLTASDCWVCPA